MAIKNLFVRDTRIIISWEERYAKIQLVYNDLVAPYKTIVEHWEHFNLLRQYFSDENASYAIVHPSQFSSAMKSINNLKSEYGSHKKMCFIIDDKVQEMRVLDAPPEGFTIKYTLSGSDLNRELPDKTIECEDGWTVWGGCIWHLPKLSDKQLNGFRRNRILREEFIQFLKQDLPLYRSAGQKIECDINIKDESAFNVEIDHVERDAVDLSMKWNVPLDSVNPEFDLYGYILSNNTIYSGLNPLEIEKFCPNVTGKNSISFNKIAVFLEEAYQKWLPWITGKIQEFDKIHHWLKPPFYTFMKVDINIQDGIGQAVGKPYILVDNECLSADLVNDILLSEYYHLRTGWIKAADLKSSIDKQIISNPAAEMAPSVLTSHQILHLGDDVLSEKWQDILFTEKYQWFIGGTKMSIALAHFDYLFKQGINGGLDGGFESFMAYGFPYLLEYLKQNEIQPLIAIDSEYKTAMNTIIENTPILKNSGVEVIVYNALNQARLNKYKLAVVIEPEDVYNLPPYYDALLAITEKCDLCMCFTKKSPGNYSNDKKGSLLKLLKTESQEDLPYLIRNVRTPQDAPLATAYSKDLRLPFADLVYHEKTVNLDK